MAAMLPTIIKGGITAAEYLAGAAAAAGATAGAAGMYNDYKNKTTGQSTGNATTVLPNGDVAYVGADGLIHLVTQVSTVAGGGGRKVDFGDLGGGPVVSDTMVPGTNLDWSVLDEAKKALAKLIGSSATSVIKYKYRNGQKGDIKGFRDSLIQDPAFIDKLVGIAGPGGQTTADIIGIIAADAAKRQALLDALRGQNVVNAPLLNIGGGRTSVGDPDGSGDPDSIGAGVAVADAINNITQTKDQGTTTTPGEVSKTIGTETDTSTSTSTSTSTKTDTQTKTETETKEEEDEDEGDDEPRKPPKPPPKPPKEKNDDSVIKETPIPSKASQRPKKGVQWYPTYNMGGQDILKLTDTEKLEELKNWSLFDLVSPLLQGDPDNLLAIQNDIVQQQRFTNTYANPRMPAPLPPLPDTSTWQYPMRDVYPVPYPMRLVNPQYNKLYYDNWSDQSNQYLNQKVNMLSGPSEPDLAQIVNSQSKNWSAIDPDIAKKGAGTKWSLLEDVDSSSVSALDIMMVTNR